MGRGADVGSQPDRPAGHGDGRQAPRYGSVGRGPGAGSGRGRTPERLLRACREEGWSTRPRLTRASGTALVRGSSPLLGGRIYQVPPGARFCLRRQPGAHVCGRSAICVASPGLVCGTAFIPGALPTPAPAVGGRPCLCRVGPDLCTHVWIGAECFSYAELR